jgi:hypothetical protein
VSVWAIKKRVPLSVRRARGRRRSDGLPVGVPRYKVERKTAILTFAPAHQRQDADFWDRFYARLGALFPEGYKLDRITSTTVADDVVTMTVRVWVAK